MSGLSEHEDVTEYLRDWDVAFWSYPVRAEGKPGFHESAVVSGSSRHLSDMIVGKKVVAPLDDYQLRTASSGHSIN